MSGIVREDKVRGIIIECMILFFDIISSYLKSTEAIIGLLSSLGSIIVAIATIITVQEMKKSRVGSIKPDLFIASRIMIISEKEFHNLTFSDDKYMFEIINLGNGPAKHLTINWVNDLESRISKLNSLHFKDNPIKTPFGGHISFEFKNVTFLLNEPNEKENYKINYVLSGGEKNPKFFIGENLIRYIIFESLIYADYHNSQDIGLYNIFNDNNSKLEIEYIDVLGYKKVIEFRINIKSTIFKNERNKDVSSIMFGFDFEPI